MNYLTVWMVLCLFLTNQVVGQSDSLLMLPLQVLYPQEPHQKPVHFRQIPFGELQFMNTSPGSVLGHSPLGHYSSTPGTSTSDPNHPRLLVMKQAVLLHLPYLDHPHLLDLVHLIISTVAPTTKHQW